MSFLNENMSLKEHSGTPFKIYGLIWQISILYVRTLAKMLLLCSSALRGYFMKFKIENKLL